MHRHKLLLNLAGFALLCTISVIVRFENLKAPLGRHHEWITAHALTTIKILESDGAARHYFAPVITFDTPADKFASSRSGFKDHYNFNYYTSYPPLCFLLPYFVDQLLQLNVSAVSIRLLGLANHFMCALLVFLILNRITKTDPRKELCVSSLAGSTIYLFSSGNLWFHGNLWFADMLVQVFVLASVYRLVVTLENPGDKLKNGIFLFLFTFLGVYTEWLAVLLSFYMSLFFLLMARKNSAYYYYVYILASATVFALFLMVMQYSQIAGFDAFKDYALNRFKFRSGYHASPGTNDTIYADKPLRHILFNYQLNYTALLYFSMLVITATILICMKKKEKLKFSLTQLAALAILLFAVLSHHVILFNFTSVHDFATLKSTLFLAVFIPLLLFKMESYFYSRRFNAALFAGASLFVYQSVHDYHELNHPEKAYLYQQTVGLAAHAFARPDELVYSNAYNSPVISWYASRGVYYSKSLQQTVEFLRRLRYKRALFVDLEAGWNSMTTKIYRVSESGYVEFVGEGGSIINYRNS